MKTWLAGLVLAAITLNLPASAADNENITEREHRGVSLLAMPMAPNKTFDTSVLPAKQALENIAKALDRLLATSPQSARKIGQLKKNGKVLLVYLPDDLMSGDGHENVAAFHPDYLQQNGAQSNRKRFLVVIGRHGVKWPRDELAATIAHELVGHGVQHLRGRLVKVRPIDAECEAYLYEEIANQDLSLGKHSREMVGFRRMLEERWCADFKTYQRAHQPKTLKLWDVLNPNVPKLLSLFEEYLEHAEKAGITARAIDALKQQAKSDRMRALRGATAARLYQAAVTLRDGGLDTIPNAEEALRYFRFAAEKGHRKAVLNVAYMYEKGLGIPKDSAEAFRWYQRAAEDGHQESQYRLGRHLYHGIGVKKDHGAAVKWIRKAAASGHAASQYSLGWMYTNGSGLQKNAQKAASWFLKSAKQGYAKAQVRLGGVYENGVGVMTDNAAAYDWYKLAAENKLSNEKTLKVAQLKLERLLIQLSTEADQQTDLAPAAEVR